MANSIVVRICQLNPWGTAQEAVPMHLLSTQSSASLVMASCIDAQQPNPFLMLLARCCAEHG
jgi:hypothetical protein